MNKFESMQIPTEADGIVDNEEAFQKMQEANEITLKQEIDQAKEQDDNELRMNDYEDMEFVAYKENNQENSEKVLRLAKRKQVLGRGALKSFKRIRLFS